MQHHHVADNQNPESDPADRRRVSVLLRQYDGEDSTVFAATNSSLPLANWTTLGSATEVSSGQFQFTDPQATNNAKRFYRVRSP
jgi:hypothetical protein